MVTLRHTIGLAATTSLLLATACRPAATDAGGTPSPAPATGDSAAATVPAATVPAATVPVESRVRVMLAGDDAGWLEGRWVVTSVGCLGVILSEAQMLVLLPTLTAVERAVTTADGGERWQPVPLSRLRDGAGCGAPGSE